MSEHKCKASGTVVKRKSFLSSIVRYLIAATVLLIVIILSFVAWIYFSLIAGPGPFKYNEYHPFKSPAAKNSYYAFEEKMAKNWPCASEERIVSTSFGKTFMRISGPQDAPPLVLLPGGGSNSYIWSNHIVELSKEYRTYALDNIYDWGRSVYTRKIESGKEFSDWLDELFDTLQIGNKIRIMGYSYGGWVTSQYALYHPEKISHVVLIAPAWTVLDAPDEYMVRMLKSLLPVRFFKEKIMYWVWNDLAQMGPEGKKLVEDRIDYYSIAMKCFKLKTGVQPTVLTDQELQKIKRPLLYIVGEHETCYDGKNAVKRLNSVAPEIETELIPNTGHDLMFTHTETVNRRITEFLKK